MPLNAAQTLELIDQEEISLTERADQTSNHFGIQVRSSPGIKLMIMLEHHV